MPNEAHRISALLLPLLLGLALPVSAAGLSGQNPPREAALEDALAGEFAVQAGRLDEAARFYLQAARTNQDAGLAGRATRTAILAADMRRARQALALWQRLAPPSPELSVASATLALRQGKRRQALAEAEKLLAEPQGWQLVLAVFSVAGTELPDSAWLLKQLHQRGALPQNELPALLAFAQLAQMQGQMELMQAIVAGAAQELSSEPRVLLLQASLALELDNKEAAREKLTQVHEVIAQTPDLRLMLAQGYERLGELALAEQVLAEGPQSLHVQAMRATLLERAGEKDKLEALYQQLQPPEDAHARHWLLLGQVAEMLEHHEQALRWYDGIQDEELAHLLRLRRAVVLHALGRKAESYAQLRLMQNSVPTDAEDGSDPRRDGFLAEAELRQKDGDREGELDAYARGLMALPDDIAILYSQALAWERFDDIERAEASLRRILLIEPDNVAALNALGYTLADRTTRYKEALELIDRARLAEPDNGAIIDSHGWVLYRLGRHQEALVQLKRAFSLHKDAEVAAHVAEVLWVMGRRDEARQYFEEARKIDPEHRALKRALEFTGAGL